MNKCVGVFLAFVIFLCAGCGAHKPKWMEGDFVYRDDSEFTLTISGVTVTTFHKEKKIASGKFKILAVTGNSCEVEIVAGGMVKPVDQVRYMQSSEGQKYLFRDEGNGLVTAVDIPRDDAGGRMTMKAMKPEDFHDIFDIRLKSKRQDGE